MFTDKSTQQKNHLTIDLNITEDDAGMRLDSLLAQQYPDISRSRWQNAIHQGDICCNGQRIKPKHRVLGGEHIHGGIVCIDDTQHNPQNIPLTVVYADDDILVIDKPAGLVVHPAAGNPDGTLLNALLHHFPTTATLPRAGIVHRLDKDTSGLMVVAHSLRAHTSLVTQLQNRSMGRTYLALVHHYVTAGGTVDAPIGRHARDRIKMAVRADGKPAITHYRIEARFEDLTLLRVQLESGRTHQIRVHMAHIRHPLVGDSIYGGQAQLPKNIAAVQREAIATFPRQALHACALHLTHPRTTESMQFSAPLPQDMQQLMDTLRALR